MRVTGLMLAIVANLVAAGCGMDDTPPTCTGCYSSTGVCLNGAQPSACGAGGSPCLTCPAGQSCEDGRCGGAGCLGCIDTTGTCQAGQSFEACGASGAACVACKSGESCLAGVCQAACNASTCPTGCCGGGQCQAGTSVAACGASGAPCATCGGGQTCSRGECVQAGCAGCKGCCSTADNACMSGDTPAACGTGGAACSSCSSGQSCVSGTCKSNPTACTASACAKGCCTSSGNCLAYGQQTLQQCGTNANPCSVCGPNTTCTQGTCVSSTLPCSSYCTAGCCKGEQCIGWAQQDSSNCGTSGATCAPCGSGSACIDGNCAGERVWTVWALSASIDATTPSGNDWDLWGGAAPDPYVVLCIGSTSLCAGDTSTTVNDTFSPYWNQPVGSYKETELTASYLGVWILDDDGLGQYLDEQIGYCQLALTLSDLTAGQVYFNCGSAYDVNFKFVQQ